MEENYIPAPRKRPGVLTVFLILSTIASVWNIITQSIVFFYTVNKKPEELTSAIMDAFESMNMPAIEGVEEAMSAFMPYAPVLSFVGLIVAMLTLTGVTFMFRLKKTGFHIYTIAKIIDTFAPALIAGVAFFSLFNLFLNMLFIFVYATYLKLMR